MSNKIISTSRIFKGREDFLNLEGKLWTELDDRFGQFNFQRTDMAGIERNNGFLYSETLFPIVTVGKKECRIFRPQLYVPKKPGQPLAVFHVIENYDGVKVGQTHPDSEGILTHNVIAYADLNDPVISRFTDSLKEIYARHGFRREIK